LVRDTKGTNGDTDVVLGEDWVEPQTSVDAELREGRRRRRFAINHSPLARKIIIFNLLGLIVLVAGVLYLNPFRTSLLYQREHSMVLAAELVADLFEVHYSHAGSGSFGSEGLLVTPELATEILGEAHLRHDADVLIFNDLGELVGDSRKIDETPAPEVIGLESSSRPTLITDSLSRVWDFVAGIIVSDRNNPKEPLSLEKRAEALLAESLNGKTRVSDEPSGGYGEGSFIVTTPILFEDQVAGVVALTGSIEELGALVRSEREQILQMFLIAILVSIGLSLVLASTIANPLSDLAAAAEIGRDKNSRKVNPGRVRIPDLTGRPDEIGRLSKALRGMVSALYDRIDANEQFAADVAHEIKNPLASLRSAIGSLRFVKKDEQREKLLDVIEHDVRRLDRLVSDISNASRLDSELVKEDEQSFDLLNMMRNITEYLGNEAQQKDVDFITDLPNGTIEINGLEARLAQVFVNLITNAISFCEEGDAIRVWARQRENRVLVVVEDTGPGIPEEALTKIFNRFYSQRPEQQFGNNSGLGLAISKQIIEAHGGVIWAENIRPTDADITSEPLGARFVVGLPV
jgi:two-component system, OmpR family, sensor histidine kinase ChvG